MQSNGDKMRKDRKLVIDRNRDISNLEISRDSNWAAWGHFLEHPVTEKKSMLMVEYDQKWLNMA